MRPGCIPSPRSGAAQALAALWLFAAAADGAAQSPDPASELARAQTLADSGRTEEARASLQAWFASGGRDEGEGASLARLLRARLASDPDSAESDYVWVAIEGDPAHAWEASMRLAQLRLMRGEPDRVLADLDRLRSSHPDDPRIGESWLWTGHAYEALGELAAACQAWRRTDPGDTAAGSAVAEAIRACDEGGTVFAVQVGAFEAAGGAEALSRRLREAGFDAYVDRSAPDGLRRVRTGRFLHLASAARFADRVRRHGFEAVVAWTGEPPVARVSQP